MLAPSVRLQRKHGSKPHSQLPAKQSPRDVTGLTLGTGSLFQFTPKPHYFNTLINNRIQFALVNGPLQKKGSAIKLSETMHIKTKSKLILANF